MMNSIYCSPTHIKIVAGEASSSGIKLSKALTKPLPQGGMINGIITDEDVMAAAFADINMRYGLSKTPTSLVIDSNSIQTKIMNVPPLKDAAIYEFIRREFSQYDLATGQETAEEDEVYDFTVTEPSMEGGGVGILAVSAPKALILSYKKVFLDAGFNFTNINIGLLSQIKLTGLIPELRSGTVLLAYVDGRVLALTIFNEGRYLLQNKYRLMNEAGTREWLTEVGGHISSMVQFSKSQRSGREISSAYFAGVTEEAVAELGAPQSYLGINIYHLPLDSKVSYTGQDEVGEKFDPGEYLLNIGNLLKR